MKWLKKALALSAAACLLMTGVSAGAGGKPLREGYRLGEGAPIDFANQLESPYYQQVRGEYAKQGYRPAAGEGIRLEPSAVSAGGQALPVGKILGRSAVLSDRARQALTWEFTAVHAGLYQLRLEYLLPEDSSGTARRSLRLDGKTPFFECDGLAFYGLYEDAGKPAVNSLGDEVKPRQREIRRWQTVFLEDGHGFYSAPLTFYLDAGTHSITMEYVEQDLYIGALEILPEQRIGTYADYRSGVDAKRAPKENSRIFQAETAASFKNDQTLRQENDADPATVPSDPKARLLNMMGGVSWSKGNQSVTWEFSVPETGLYTLNLRYGQIWLHGLPSYRRISLDGAVPFSELLEYRFAYGSSWQGETLSDRDGTPFEFYLEAGDHSIAMTVKFGEMTEVIQSLNDDSILMSNLMLDLLRVAGSEPDPNYDYEFFKTIPTLEASLKTLAESLGQKARRLVEISGGKTPGFANSLLATQAQVEELIRDPFLIARRMGDLTNIQASLGAWYLEFQTQPLMIDYFEAGSPDHRFAAKKSSVWSKLHYMLTSLYVSFIKDYDNVGSLLGSQTKITQTLNVWIARGTEWAALTKELADEQFTQETGIHINLNIMPASQLNAGAVNALMLSITSGKAPDVAMGVDPASPVEFAIRKAVLDLSALPGFEEQVRQRFIAECLVPFRYRGGIYALPDTMDFRVLIYRRDIVSKLGLAVPDTRSQLYDDVLPALYQNGMNFFYPRDDSQFIYQNGAAYYTADGLRSGLDTPEAYLAFRESTELYTDYGIPVTASFYNRFRSGEMPMGIGSFADYIQISIAAPELAGKWAVAPLPGVRRPDGSVDRTVGNITGQCSLILSRTKKAEAAWSFLKWWSDSRTQTDFGREIEALLGKSARWSTANVQAFRRMPWPAADLDVIEEMWTYYREVPVVLGGYFTARHFTNAWNSVVISGAPVRDSLEEAVREINRELRVKQLEYGIRSAEED